MLDVHEIDYLLQSTLSSVKRYGGHAPSLSHLAEVVSKKWRHEFVEVFGDDGTQSVAALLANGNFIGDEAEVRGLLTTADDRRAVLTALQERLGVAISAALAVADDQDESQPTSEQIETDKDQAASEERADGWSSRARRYLAVVQPRSDLLERNEALDHILSAFLQSRRRTPIVLGTKGSGRTALMGGVAARLSEEGASPLWRVEPGLLGPEPEGPLAGVIGSCPEGATLVIDDLDKLAALGAVRPNLMVLRVLSAALLRPDCRLILICEQRNFSKLDLLAEDLIRETEPIRLAPISDAGVREIVEKTLRELETHHGVKFSDELLAAAYAPPGSTDFSVHPGLALDRLDAAASRARVQGTREVGLVHFATVNSAPKTPLRATDLFSRLCEHVDGQDHAVRTVASRLALTLARLDLRPSRPDGVFLFVGPTGVGKTKLARALSLCLFGGEDRLIQLDMSEYAHDWAVSRLVGPMPGYVGSTEPQSWLTTKVNELSDCVVLLDEIEKAHPIIWNTFLQVFDAGRLTDSRGVTADFANTVIVMTSNLGATASTSAGLGFGNASMTADRNRHKIMSTVKEVMAPELINRIDEIVVFDPLDSEAIERIAAHELISITERLASNGWSVKYEPEVVRHIARSGYDPTYGARHLQRNIERGFLSLIASSDLKVVEIVVDGDELALNNNRQMGS